MPSPPSMPTSIACAILGRVSDAVAVFDRRSKLPLWTNTAWQELCSELPVPGDQPHYPESLAQELGSLIDAADEETNARSLTVELATGEIAEFQVQLAPYLIDDQPYIAVQMTNAIQPPSALTSRSRVSQADPLTGLPDRYTLLERLKSLHANRAAISFAVLFIDLDGFKQINDRWGHLAGDKLLTEVAQRMARAIRQQDFIARYGGDEFVVLVNGVDSSDDLAPIMKRLRQAAKKPNEYANLELELSASIGAALSTEGWQSIEAMIHAADQRMYDDKQNQAPPGLNVSSR